MAATCSAFLNVQDIEKSLAFYRGLGFKVEALHRGRDGGGPVRYADLSYQGAELGLGWIGSNDDPGYRAWVGTPLGAGVLLYFAVPDVDKVFGKAKAQGALIEHEPVDRSYGRVFTLNDPDGYVVSFLQEPRRAKAVAQRVRKAAKKAVSKAKGARKTPAARSLEAASRQAVKKGATRKGDPTRRRAARGLKRVP